MNKRDADRLARQQLNSLLKTIMNAQSISPDPDCSSLERPGKEKGNA
jgi:hypothetical protein